MAECRSVIGARSPKCRGASLELRADFAPPGASSRSSRAATPARFRGRLMLLWRDVCCLHPRAGCVVRASAAAHGPPRGRQGPHCGLCVHAARGHAVSTRALSRQLTPTAAPHGVARSLRSAR